MRRALLLLVLPVMLVGCGGGDPMLTPVKATSPTALTRWRIQVDGRFAREQWREFDGALQEIRLGIMAERAASGSEAIEREVCARIDGKGFREVLVLAYEAKLERLGPVRDEMRRSLEGNALLVTAPGDASGARYLDGLRERQENRLRATLAEISAARARLAELGVPGAAAAVEDAVAGDPARLPALSRDAVWAEFAAMVEGQRGAAALKYGAVPVRIDVDGARLQGAEREDFLARRDRAAANGGVVIAVSLKGRWWIYEGRAETPRFTRVVTDNLSPMDHTEMAAQWWMLQAEIWARREAFEEARAAAEER